MRLAGVWRGGVALGLVSVIALAAAPAAAQSANPAMPDRIGRPLWGTASVEWSPSSERR
ncbi:hypothetical protein WEI85_17715 [Actinomycetes bacterium KLBMP 9797]